MSTQPVIVVVVAQSAEPALAQIASDNNWPLRWRARAAEALRSITGERPQVAVLQVAADSFEAFDVIRRLREGLPPVRTVAVAADPDEAAERSARMAGAGGFVHLADCPAVLEQTVTALLSSAARDRIPAPPGNDGRAASIRTSSPLSSSFTKHRAAGPRVPPPCAGAGRGRIRRKTRRRVSRDMFGSIQGEFR